MSSNEAGTGKPQVVFVYYTYTQQSACVVETMADVPRERGCDVRQAQIDTDKRWAEQFSRLPFGKGENRERYLGIKIRPSSSSRTTRSRRAPFASDLADGLVNAQPNLMSEESVT